MRDKNILSKSEIMRRHSYDDYFLFDNKFERGFSMNGRVMSLN